MKEIGISQEREDKIVNYLREYIKLCKNHSMYVTGAIGADTALWDERLPVDENDFKADLKGQIGCIIYGGLGGCGLFSDDGNHLPPKEQLDRIAEKVWR